MSKRLFHLINIIAHIVFIFILTLDIWCGMKVAEWNKYLGWVIVFLAGFIFVLTFWGQFIKLFWLMSNYGRSTWWIILSFFGFAFLFATIYRLWPHFVAFNGKADITEFNSFLHAFYFSVVTMTTLGFGDIAANPDSHLGQILLMVQVLLGYLMLGALVTRFAVLFTAGGPAAKFTKLTKQKEKTNPKS